MWVKFPIHVAASYRSRSWFLCRVPRTQDCLHQSHLCWTLVQLCALEPSLNLSESRADKFYLAGFLLSQAPPRGQVCGLWGHNTRVYTSGLSLLSCMTLGKSPIFVSLSFLIWKMEIIIEATSEGCEEQRKKVNGLALCLVYGKCAIATYNDFN